MCLDMLSLCVRLVLAAALSVMVPALPSVPWGASCRAAVATWTSDSNVHV